MGNGSSSPAKQSTPNDKVKARADTLVGQPVVGRGECYDLADDALKKAGAKSAPDFGTITDTADYKWGTPVSDLKLVLPGDILQFRDHEVTITTDTTTTETYPDGASKWATDSQTRVAKRGHHTAVISATDGAGVFTVVEQHVMDPSTKRLSTVVRKNTLHVTGGTKTLPTKVTTRNDPKKGQVKIEVETTVTITVQGTIWAYRPEK